MIQFSLESPCRADFEAVLLHQIFVNALLIKAVIYKEKLVKSLQFRYTQYNIWMKLPLNFKY